jgi:hypothetical protein
MYYNYVNGVYVEDPNGILPGVEGTDVNGNRYKAIAFMLNFTSLQYGQSIEWIYRLEIQAVGRTDWQFMRNESMQVSNGVYVNISTGQVVPPEEALEDDGSGNMVIKAGYMTQLHFFVDTYFKDMYTAASMYQYFIDEIIRKEGITEGDIKFNKPTKRR